MQMVQPFSPLSTPEVLTVEPSFLSRIWKCLSPSPMMSPNHPWTVGPMREEESPYQPSLLAQLLSQLEPALL